MKQLKQEIIQLFAETTTNQSTPVQQPQSAINLTLNGGHNQIFNLHLSETDADSNANLIQSLMTIISNNRCPNSTAK